MDIFSKRLKNLREAQKSISPIWTQGYVAEKIHVARPTYTAYERGTKVPSLETVNKIADLFDVSSDYLLGRTENPNSDLSITYTSGSQYEDEDEREFIEQQIELYRKMKKRMQERLRQDQKE